MWPTGVTGCAAVVERLVLPPDADDQLPDDPASAQEFAREHPDRQEVRIVAGATRHGATYCAFKLGPTTTTSRSSAGSTWSHSCYGCWGPPSTGGD